MGFRQDEPQRQASQPKTGCRPQRHKCQANSNEQVTREAALVLDEMGGTASQQQRERRHRRKHVARQFRLRKAEKHHRKEGPAPEEQPWRVRPALLLPELYGVTRNTDEQHSPRQQAQQQDRGVEPERLAMLKDRSEVTLQVVREEKCADELRVACGAEHVPWKRRDGESDDRKGVCQPERCAPAPRQNSPQPNASSRQDDGRWPFRQRCKTQEDAERRSEERRVGKECRSRWSPYH